MTESPATVRPGRSRTATALFCVILAQLMIVMDMTIVSVALPSIQADLHFDDQQRQWIVTAYTLAFGGLVIFGGKLVQLLDLRVAYLGAVCGFALASLAGGLAQSFIWLAAARTVQGMFAGVLAPTNLSMLSRTFTEARSRARAFALFGATGGIGAAVGLLLGGVITDALDWRWCLFINLGIGLVAGIGVLRLRGLGAVDRQPLFADLLGLVLGCGAVFSLVYGFSEAGRTSWHSTATIGWLVAAGSCAGLFLLREWRAADPLLPLGILWNPGRASAYGVLALAGWVQIGSVITANYYFQDTLHWTATQSGLAFLPLIGTLILGSFVANLLVVPRWGIKTAFPLGLAVVAVAFWFLSQITPSSGYAGDVLTGLLIGGFGLGFVFGPAMSAGTRGVAEARSGLANAMLSTSQQIGASFGVAFLSTFTVQHVTARLHDETAQIGAAARAALMSAQALPDSPEGKQIVARIIAQHRLDATVSAYGAGFGVIGWTALVLAAALIVAGVALVVVRRQRTDAGPQR